MTSQHGAQAHLTEEERQEMADGSLPADRAREVQAHLRTCSSCSRDVERMERLVRRAREAPALSSPAAEDLWPAIRTRIDGGKLVPLPRDSELPGLGTRDPGPPTRDSRLGDRASRASRASAFRSRSFIGIAAAAIAAAALLLVVRHDREPIQDAQAGTEIESTTSIAAADDSARAYQEEAEALLAQLELRRAMLRPETAEAVDHDLAVVDSAIAEVRAAIARDPNNPALRQLLALSYRKKVEVLQRVSNAG